VAEELAFREWMGMVWKTSSIYTRARAHTQTQTQVSLWA